MLAKLFATFKSPALAQPSHKPVLDFWFGPTSGTDMWFGGSPEVDALVRANFASTLDLALQSKLAAWEEEPESALALIVVLDQFGMQLNRKQKAGYEASNAALSVAVRAIDRDFDKQLLPTQRLFMYVPFMHSEDLVLQERGVKLFTRLAEETPDGPIKQTVQGFVGFAQKHLDIVKQYNRFPGRNKAYGRVNTPAEEDYLAKGGYF